MTKEQDMVRKSNPQLAPVGDAVTSVVANATKAANADLIASLEAQAVASIKGDLHFKIDQFTYDVPASLARQAQVAMALDSALYGRWRETEKEVSEKFNAPECYSNQESVEHRALVKFLQSASAIYVRSYDTVEALKVKKGLDPDEVDRFNGAKGSLKEANRTIARAIKAMYEHYKAGLDDEAAARAAKDRKAPRLLGEQFAEKMGKLSQADDMPPADQEIALILRQAVQWAMSDPVKFKVAHLDFQKAKIQAGQ